MADEKNRLGDKLHDKERGEEEHYFGRREKDLLEKMKQKAGATAAPGGTRCPKDGTALVPVDRDGVSAEECPTCGGLWVDKREAETVARREKNSWLGRLVHGLRK